MLVVGVLSALLIGISLGLLGGGGSILTVPILLYVFQLPPREAIATSLLVVGSTSAAALIPHARAGRVRWKTGAFFGAASMLGAYLAGRVAKYIPAGILVLLFGAMMLVTAVAMMRGRKNDGSPNDAPSGDPSSDRNPSDLPVLKVLAEGLAVGGVTGLVGAGGGFLVVPALVLLGGLPMGIAVGTSLLVIAMKSFAGFAGYLSSVHVPWGIAGTVVAAAIVGSVLGGRLVSFVPADKLRKGFAWFVVVMAIFILGQEVPKLFGFQVTVATHWPWLLAAMAAPPITAALISASRRQPHAA